MSDDANVDARVGQAPECVGYAFDRRHGRKEPVFVDGECMQFSEAAGSIQVPFGEIPGSLKGQGLRLDGELPCHDLAESRRIVATDTVEINAEDERFHLD